MRNVRQLVAEHTLELFGVEPAQDARGRADDRMLRVASGGERVGHVCVGDRDARLGHVGERTQAVHDAVQLRRFLGRDDASAHAVERHLVGEVVLREQQAARDDDDETDADVLSNQQRNDSDVQRADEEHRERHPGDEASV